MSEERTYWGDDVVEQIIDIARTHSQHAVRTREIELLKANLSITEHQLAESRRQVIVLRAQVKALGGIPQEGWE
jgi:hypothetical protein